MKRTIFSPEHEIFRQSVRAFFQREVVPHQERWAEQGMVDREVWRKAGAAGLLCPWLSDEEGGPGGDLLHSLVIIEEQARVYESGLALSLHSDIVVPYLVSFASDELKRRYLPGCVSGEIITAIAMTEPGTGSDLAAIATTARLDGDHYVLNGAKTFITNGILCDLCVVAARSESGDNPHQNLSLFAVDAGTPGFHKGKKLKKMGMASQDTSELFFEDCRIPAGNIIGPAGGGFLMLMQKLQQERLVVAAASQAGAEVVLADAIKYVQERKAFGKPIAKFQNTQFKLAECATEVEVGRVVDACLQMYGGYGYMLEYPISRAYMDARVQRIYAGTNEVMKLIISKQMGL